MRRFVQQRHQRLIRNSVFGVGKASQVMPARANIVTGSAPSWRISAGSLARHPRVVPIPGTAANREQTSLDASSHSFLFPAAVYGVARRYCAQANYRSMSIRPASFRYRRRAIVVDLAECQLVEKREDKRSRKPLVSNPQRAPCCEESYCARFALDAPVTTGRSMLRRLSIIMILSVAGLAGCVVYEPVPTTSPAKFDRS